MLQVRLILTAGQFGIFPEPELIAWLRAVSGRPGKILVVQPIEPLDSATMQPRTFQSDELSIAPERIGEMIELLHSIGFPDRVLEIDDTSDPESIWWAHVTLEVTLDDVSEHLEFSLGPEGVRGRDAASLKNIFRAMFQVVGIRSYWFELLGGGAEDGS